MKKTTILFLGLALMSMSSFASEGQFDVLLGSKTSSAVVREDVANDLQKEDNKFLSHVEEMQKSIRLMQLELKEKELKYKVEEQDKKMDALLNPPAKSEDAVLEYKPMNSIFGSIPNNMQDLTPKAAVKGIDEMDDEAASTVYVTSIKGLNKDLVAFVESDDIGGSFVSVGDTINNGYLVRNISKNTVTFETAEGDIEVVGLTFRK